MEDIDDNVIHNILYQTYYEFPSENIKVENINLKDKKIIHFLSLNARESDSQIAKEVGLSRAAVTYRIKK